MSFDIEDVLQKLDIGEKAGLLSGSDMWHTSGVPRLNIPKIRFSDGPHGLRGTSFFNGLPGHLLPSATGMAATFNCDLVHSIGVVLASEAVVKGVDMILAPTVCIPRSPLIGRGFESFSEDPHLAGRVAAAYINGIQSLGIGAVIKHYAAHDQSKGCHSNNAIMSARALREVHLMPFQIAIKYSRPWSVMTAYNCINGTHCSEDPFLLQEVLRKEWGWEGLVVSDWWGTYSTSKALKAGLDLEMPGPARFRGLLASWSVESRALNEAIDIDSALRNILRTVQKCARTSKEDVDISGNVTKNDTVEHRSIVQQAAVESIVLIKNENGVLPINPKKKLRLALIGPRVEHPSYSGGGSADLPSYYAISPREGIARVFSGDIEYHVGCYGHKLLPVIERGLSVPGSREPGMKLDFYASAASFDAGEEPVETIVTKQTNMFFGESLPSHIPVGHYLRATTQLRPPAGRKFRFGLGTTGRARLVIDGTTVISIWDDPRVRVKDPEVDTLFGPGIEKYHVIEARNETDSALNLAIEVQNGASGDPNEVFSMGITRLGGCEYIESECDSIAKAAKLAGEVDVPIVIVGTDKDWECEGDDRSSIDLPGRQAELVERVCKASPSTVVVIQAGMPISMPFLSSASTVLHTWFGGQELGNALANVLFGIQSPSGRLPVTFMKRTEDNPAFLSFGNDHGGDAFYGEGVYVGHRYYEKCKIPVNFPLGYGLSYAEWRYSNLAVSLQQLDASDLVRSATAEVNVDVTNTSQVGNALETILCFVSPVCTADFPAFGRPARELKAFTKISVDKGETKTASMKLDKYAFSYWQPSRQQWIIESGEYEMHIVDGKYAPDNNSRNGDGTADGQILKVVLSVRGTAYWNGL